MPITGYAKLNENCKQVNSNERLSKQAIFLYECNQFNSLIDILPLSNKQAISKLIIKVTGNDPSMITEQWEQLQDWKGVDIYLLSPSGIIIENFEPQHQINNNLYFSTAQYFSVQNNQFKFKHIPKQIEIKNSQLVFAPKKTFSILGGQIKQFNSSILLPDGDIHLIAAESVGHIKITKNGKYQPFFNKLANIEIIRSYFRAHDKFKIHHNPCLSANASTNIPKADIDLSGQAGGLAFIRAHNLTLDNSWVFSDTYCDLTGKGIDIELDNDLELKRAGRITTDIMASSAPEGKGGNINIKTDNHIILDAYSFEEYPYIDKIHGKDPQNFDQMFSTIATSVYGAGNSGDIKLETQHFMMKNRAAIQTSLSESSEGDSGSVKIHAQQSIILEDYAQFNMFAVEGSQGNIGHLELKTQFLKLQDSIIRLQNAGVGEGGGLSIQATNIDILNTDKNLAWIRRKCRDLDMNDNTATDNTDTSKPQASILGFVREKAKKTSDVKIKAKNITLSEGAYIGTSSLNHAKGGSISIVADNMTLKGHTCPSRIISAAINNEDRDGEGNGGDIFLNIQDKLFLKQGSAIIANSYTKKPKDNSSASNSFCEPDINPSANNIKSNGISGNIDITGKKLILDNHSRITVKSSNQKQAGEINLIFNTINVQNQSCILAYSKNTGGGNVDITVDNELYVDNSKITASTSSHLEGYSGGNVTIKQPKLIALNHSHILAKAYEASKGGEIDIKTDVLLQSAMSSIDASSEKGIDGEEKIAEFKTDFAKKLILQSPYVKPIQPTAFRACSNQEQNTLWILEQEYLTSHPFLLNTPVGQPKNCSKPATQNGLYNQSIDSKVDIKAINIQGKSRFSNQIADILQTYNLPSRLSRLELMEIQDKIQILYDEYYAGISDGYDKGQLYSTHTTVRIPNQSITDGIINIVIVEEKLADIRFIEQEGKNQLPVPPDFIKSRLITGSIFRTQDLNKALQALLERGLFEKFDAKLQTGEKASEKILYISLKPNPLKPTKKAGLTEYPNQLKKGDYAYKMLSDNTNTWYRHLFLNRTDTRLESLISLQKHDIQNLDFKSRYYLQKIALNQPIYKKRYVDQQQKRVKDELQLSIQLKKQTLDAELKQKPFNLFLDMLKGQKRQDSYGVGQQWSRVHEDLYTEQINSTFNISIKAKNQAHIFSYQHNKQWDTGLKWKLSAQFANQHSKALDYFSLGNNHAIRGYPENKFADNNGFASRLHWQYTNNIQQFAIQFFLDIGSVWNSQQSDINLLETLWQQKKQHLYESLKAYKNDEKTENQPAYVKKLGQPLWNQSATSQLSNILLTHWQNTLDACHEIFAQPIDINNLSELNIYKADKQGNQCNLQLLLSAGIRLNWDTADKSKEKIFAKRSF